MMKGWDEDGICPTCKRHQGYGCAFTCADRKPPLKHEDYRAWAEEQKQHYANGERPKDA